MRRVLLASALLLAMCGEVVGNTGVFFGSGQSIQLVKSADVQMVSEDVLITPRCGATATMGSAEYRCEFVLKNLSSKAVRIQVGFPLNRETHGPPRATSDETDEVFSFHFIARDANNTYHVRYVGRDQKDHLVDIFLWDMDFAPNEKKTLHVGYIMPMSFAEYTTAISETPKIAFNPPKVELPAWQPRIQASVVVGCSYVTETGKSWAGPIEKARFRFIGAEFEEYFRQQPLGGDSAETPPDHGTPDESSSEEPGSADDDGFVVGMKFGTVCRRISPDGWKPMYLRGHSPSEANPSREPDGIGWEFDNYKPGPPLQFVFYLVGFPQTPAECDPWVRQVLGQAPGKAAVLELRETVAAFFGVAPQAASVRALVEKQFWYDPKSSIRESQLSEAKKAVLARLSKIADEQKEVSVKSTQALSPRLLEETGLRANSHGQALQVSSVAFSADRKTLASGSFDRTVSLREAATGKCIVSIEGHASPVMSVAFSRDGKTLASADMLGTIMVWDLIARKNIGVLKEHTESVVSVAFSPDGKTLASASEDMTVKLWNVATGKVVATFHHDTNINAVAFSPDGRIVASGGYDNRVYLWDVATKKRTAVLKVHKDCIFSLAFTPNGRTLASGSGDGTIKLWDVVAEKCNATLADGGCVLSVAFTNDGKTLASGNRDATIELWDVATGKISGTLGKRICMVNSLSFSPDGKTLASSGDFGDLHDNTVKLWDVSRAKAAK